MVFLLASNLLPRILRSSYECEDGEMRFASVLVNSCSSSATVVKNACQSLFKYTHYESCPRGMSRKIYRKRYK